jgi:single-strand selective monofunctional uracil DNA glycosylase
VLGFACPRSEVSGQRLWGFFKAKFGTPERFFADHYVHNYCPLLFLQDTKSGKNLTPDQLPANASARLFELCDEFLRLLADELRIECAVGVGTFAGERLSSALAGRGVKLGKILHPSPASPAANRDWAGTVEQQLRALGAYWVRRIPSCQGAPKWYS